MGTYEIAGVIGCGGMGVVLKGFGASLNRFVAIKVLAPHLASSGAARRRFAREAKAAAAVVHDNVVAIHGVAESNGMPYLVMPYIRGESLQKRRDKRGPFALPEILRVGMQVAAGLAAAHAQGLVHRNIKPANILLEDGVERLRITDFGLARAADDASLTHSGVIAGTPQYMSPEQARGEVIDGRSDLFSLRSVLYALCTGRPPFRAETAYGVLHRLWQTTPRPIRDVNPDIPDWLAGVVMTLLQKSPNDRFESAEVVARLMEQCLAHAQQPDQVALPQAATLCLTSLTRKACEFFTIQRIRYDFIKKRPHRVAQDRRSTACLNESSSSKTTESKKSQARSASERSPEPPNPSLLERSPSLTLRVSFETASRVNRNVVIPELIPCANWDHLSRRRLSWKFCESSGSWGPAPCATFTRG